MKSEKKRVVKYPRTQEVSKIIDLAISVDGEKKLFNNNNRPKTIKRNPKSKK
jgi:hypothetical protein